MGRTVLIASLIGLSMGLVLAAALEPVSAPNATSIWALCLADQAPATPDRIWASWSLAPATIALLSALLATSNIPPIASRQGIFFLAGWGLLALALLSPLCRLAATTATGHMLQHVLLVALAPALLAMANLREPIKRVSRLGSQSWSRADLADRRIDQWLAKPLVAGALYGLAIWLAHMPAIYEAALLNPAPHLAALCLLIVVSLNFWRVVLTATPVAGLALCLATIIHTGFLGALLTFAPSPWYAVFGDHIRAWGLSPLEDQQIAGMIMWVPMAGLYLAAGLWSLGRLIAPISQPT